MVHRVPMDRPVGVEALVGESERDIIRALLGGPVRREHELAGAVPQIDIGQVAILDEIFLEGVGEQAKAGHPMRDVVGRHIVAVIVIPHRARGLGHVLDAVHLGRDVRVEIVALLVREHVKAGMAVGVRRRVPAVQVQRRFRIPEFILRPDHHRLAQPGPDGRPGGDAIVAEDGRVDVRENLRGAATEGEGMAFFGEGPAGLGIIQHPAGFVESVGRIVLGRDAVVHAGRADRCFGRAGGRVEDRGRQATGNRQGPGKRRERERRGRTGIGERAGRQTQVGTDTGREGGGNTAALQERAAREIRTGLIGGLHCEKRGRKWMLVNFR